MQDCRVVTFLAKPRDGVPRTPPDGNTAIDDLRRVLIDVPSHQLFEVASLLDIVLHLGDLRDKGIKPQRIQIAGHGTEGLLALGYYWDNKYTDDDNGPFYLLDSNPYAYGIMQAFIEPPTRVVLIGCFVGSCEPSPMVARGCELIYDLHAMWGCDVLAADDFVGPENFNDGLFVGSAQGYVRGVWRRSPGLAAPAPRPIAIDPQWPAAPKFTNVRITGAPALGAAPRSFAPGIPVNVDHYAREVRLGHLTAMNEVSLEGELDGVPAQLYLICNSRFLKAVLPSAAPTPRFRYFAAADTADPLDADIFEQEGPGAQVWAAIRRETARMRLADHQAKLQRTPGSIGGAGR